MIAYKGFTETLYSRLGDGKQENCSFCIGETKTVPESKTARNGFHCCENPFDCLTYYHFDGKNRFFKVEAAGDIDEDDGQRIACTQITLLEELTPVKFALEGMKYIINHPLREKWQQSHCGVKVMADYADSGMSGHIAIARGEAPVVMGVEGSILGLIVEKGGEIKNCKLFVVSSEQAGKRYRLNIHRELEVCT